MELRQILAVVLGLALLVLSVAPYIKARELTMETPSGWEVLGSKRLRVPLRELQEIYSPDGTPTGRYGRPIDHDWFGEGKLLEIGGIYIYVLDTYQDARGCHLRVKIKNLEGELTVAGGQSQGAQWDDLRLYITWAKFPPEEGDWRTARGEYFYGFEEFELTLYRVPTAPAIPLSAVGAVLGAGLVLFGVMVVREGERKGILPVLVGSAFLCALIVRFPGYEAVQPVATYARINWLGALTLAASEDGSRYVVASKDNVTLYDHWGNRLWVREMPWENTLVSITADGSLVLCTGVSEFMLLRGEDGGLLLRKTWYGQYDPYGFPRLSYKSGLIAYGENATKVVVIDSSGNVIFSRNFTGVDYVALPMLDDNGRRLAVVYVVRPVAGFSIIDLATGQEIWNISPLEPLAYCLSRTGKYLIIDNWHRLLIYDIDAKQLIGRSGDENVVWNTDCMLFSPVPILTPNDNVLVYISRDVYGSNLLKLVQLPSLYVTTYTSSYNLYDGCPAVTPSGDTAVVALYDKLISFGSLAWSSPLPLRGSYSGSPIGCSRTEIYTHVACGKEQLVEAFVTNFKYSLSIAAPIACLSVNGGSPTRTYYSVDDPVTRTVVDIVNLPVGATAVSRGNFTEMDNIRSYRLEIYADNDKSIYVWVKLAKPEGLSVSPTAPFPEQSVTLSWSPVDGANYYEVKIDENIVDNTISTSYTFYPPENVWSSGTHYVGVRAGNTTYGFLASDWAEATFTVQPVVVPGPLPPTPPRPSGRLQLAAMIPMLPHPLVSVFNALGQIAGVYTLSLLMVLSGLTIITVGTRRW